MTGRLTTAARWAAALLTAGLLAGCSSQGSSGQAEGVTVAGQVKAAVDGYTANHGLAFGSSAAMTEYLASAVAGAKVVDGNTKPDAAKRSDAQVAVLVSGGPMFAFGVYDATAHDGQGVCHYASTYGAGVGRWAYATGTVGVPCGGVRHGSSELNTLAWSTDAPAWARGGARQVTHGALGPSALLSAPRATENP